MGRLTLCLIVAACSGLTGAAQSVVIGTKTATGKITFQPAEDFLIEQSKKIRLLPENSPSADPSAIKKLQKTEIAQAGIIRNDGQNRLVRLNDAGKPSDIVLPENFALKAPAKTSEIPGRLALTVVRSKKAKQSDTIAPEEFFVYLNGPTPDQAVLDLIDDSSNFKNPAEQIAAMEGFVASFKDAPGVLEFRRSLERRLRDGLDAFESGGADKDLRALQPFAEMGKRAFAGYAPIEQLRAAIFGRVAFVDDRIVLLKSLGMLEEWDKFLDMYADFEKYQWSFPAVIELRKTALEESARVHARRALGYQLRGDHLVAIEQGRLALSRDPRNKDLENFVNGESVLASQAAAKENASRRKILGKGTPEEDDFLRYLTFADRSIKDKKFGEAADHIRNAETRNPGSPEVLLRKAQLVAGQGRLTEAIKYLDEFDNLVSDPAERQTGRDGRNNILYDLDTKRTNAKREIDTLLTAGEYSKLDNVLREALNVDPADPDFQYEGGIVAAVLRDRARARELLAKYLQRSNALDGDLKKRDAASRLLSALSVAHPADAGKGTPNWFSRRKLPDGVFYCPESLAFQVPIESVSGNKARIAFNWDKDRLQSIQTGWEDEKGRRAYLSLASLGGADSDAGLPGSGEELGTFYFHYYSSGQLRAVRSKKSAEALKDFSVRVGRDGQKRRLIDSDGQPAVVLPSNTYVDTELLGVVEAASATIVAGNSFFNPFLWDGIHYFSVKYDAAGHVNTAEEWNTDNTVRLYWEGDRLTEIRAYRKNSETPYYRRSISYAGGKIVGEEESAGGRNNKIKYIYSGESLSQVKVEHDGKEWTAKPRS